MTIPDEAMLPLLLAGMAVFAIPALWVSSWGPALRRIIAMRDQSNYWQGWRDGRRTRNAK